MTNAERFAIVTPYYRETRHCHGAWGSSISEAVAAATERHSKAAHALTFDAHRWGTWRQHRLARRVLARLARRPMPNLRPVLAGLRLPTIHLLAPFSPISGWDNGKLVSTICGRVELLISR